MKYLMMPILLMSITANASIQFQGEVIHQDKLWKIPAPKEIQTTFESDAKLEQKCFNIEAMADRFRERDITNYVITHFDRLRNEPLTFDFPNDLYSEFKIHLPEEVEFQAIYQGITDRQNTVSLPHFVSNKSIITLWVPSVVESRLEIKYSEQSLMAFSKAIGLNSLRPKMKQLNNHYILEVKQLDLACDLLKGRASVTAQVETFVSPTKDHQARLNGFYNEKMAPLLDTISEFKSNKIKAAALYGSQLGTLISDEVGLLSFDEMKNYFSANLDLFFKADSLEAKLPLFKPANQGHQVEINSVQRTHLPVIIKGNSHE